jgi:protein TonB
LSGPFEQAPNEKATALTYPERALQEGLEGVVRLTCNVTTDQRFAPCSVVSESPAGYNFGKQALLLTPLYILRKGSMPPPGSQITFNLKYSLPRR